MTLYDKKQLEKLEYYHNYSTTYRGLEEYIDSTTVGSTEEKIDQYQDIINGNSSTFIYTSDQRIALCVFQLDTIALFDWYTDRIAMLDKPFTLDGFFNTLLIAIAKDAINVLRETIIK